MDAALHLAASVGNLQVVEAVVDQGAGIWHRDSSGKTAVEMAVELKKAELTMYLVELVLSSSRAKDLPPGRIEVARTGPHKDDPSALHHAISRNYQNAAVALIEDGEDIFKTNATGETFLSLAVDKVARTVVRALVGKYADAIFEAKHLEKGIRVVAAASNKPLDVYCYTELDRYWKDRLFASWTAVMHLEEAFDSTNDPEMRRLLTPAWQKMSWKTPTQLMALGMDLTQSTLHGTVIDSTDTGSTQRREVSSFGSRRIGHRRHVRREKSRDSRLAKRQRHPFEDEKETEGEGEESDSVGSWEAEDRGTEHKDGGGDVDDDDDDDDGEDEDEDDGDDYVDVDDEESEWESRLEPNSDSCRTT